MNKYNNFREFYDKELLPELQIIESDRKRIVRVVLITLTVVVSLILAIILLIPSEAEALRVIVPALAVIAGLITISIVSKDYRAQFKTRIISRITQFADTGLVYTPQGRIPRSVFVNSRIFRQSCDIYRGEDHFRGRIGKTDIEFSEVVAKQKGSSGKSGNKNQYTMYFKGIFVVAEFNKHFKTHTLVLPDTAEKLFGSFGRNLQTFSPGRGSLVKLEDLVFEKEFCVYGEDQIEARYILTPSMMQRIMAFKKRWNTTVYLSFLDSKVYIAIRMYKNLFETRLFKSVVDYRFIEENIKFLELLTGIVDDLNLNTRIWTKK
ncbi:MAG: DUF3137 domain-containing protein [Bacteroidales bacterium]|nr:DUF3137 domain-containing protein [Bacteroidales bacterium]